MSRCSKTAKSGPECSSEADRTMATMCRATSSVSQDQEEAASETRHKTGYNPRDRVQSTWMSLVSGRGHNARLLLGTGSKESHSVGMMNLHAHNPATPLHHCSSLKRSLHNGAICRPLPNR